MHAIFDFYTRFFGIFDISVAISVCEREDVAGGVRGAKAEGLGGLTEKPSLEHGDGLVYY